MDTRSIFRKHFPTVAIGIAVIAGVGYWIYSSWSSNQDMRSREQATQQQRQETTKQVQELSTRYNAFTDWRQQVDKEKYGLYAVPYTIDVQNALVRTDGRPILFFASVLDIVRESDRYQVHMCTSPFPPQLGSLQVHLFLHCTETQVQKILPHPQNALALPILFDVPFDRFAVVAHVSEIRKVRLALTADGYTYAEDVVVDMQLRPSPNVFYAKGECLDVLFVGDYRPPLPEPAATD